MAPTPGRLMDGPLVSRMSTVARAQVAVALSVADGMQRYIEVSAKFGESLAEAASVVTRAPAAGRAGGWDQAAARARRLLRLCARAGGAPRHPQHELLRAARRPARTVGRAAHAAECAPADRRNAGARPRARRLDCPFDRSTGAAALIDDCHSRFQTARITAEAPERPDFDPIPAPTEGRWERRKGHPSFSS
jgi:hypothetical protein